MNACCSDMYHWGTASMRLDNMRFPALSRTKTAIILSFSFVSHQSLSSHRSLCILAPRRPAMTSAQILSLHVIYDADGTLTGEVVYYLRKTLGLGHCSACDITHGARCEKQEFTLFKQRMPVPVRNIHRDEMDARMRLVAQGRLPCVVARTEERDVVVVDRHGLERCNGDVDTFAGVLDKCIREKHLHIDRVPAPGKWLAARDREEEEEDGGSMDAVVPSKPE